MIINGEVLGWALAVFIICFSIYSQKYMTKKKNPKINWSIYSFFLCAYLGTVLVMKDRLLPMDAIWTNHLWFLIAPFIFGILYKQGSLGLSFFLLMELGARDFTKGWPPGTDPLGANYLGAFVVWSFTIPAGLAGWGLSFLIPKYPKSVKGKKR